MGRQIAIDSPIFIYVLERHPEYLSPARSLLSQVQSGEFVAVLSVVGLIEILTGPKKRGRFDVAKEYKDLITHFPNLTIMGINDNIVELSSNLRAKYNLATPDAVHIATAVDFGAEKFITNDRNLRQVKEIAIELL